MICYSSVTYIGVFQFSDLKDVTHSFSVMLVIQDQYVNSSEICKEGRKWE